MKAAINLLKIALAGAETNQKAPEPYPGYKERDLAPYIKDLREALSLLQRCPCSCWAWIQIKEKDDGNRD